MNVALPSIQDDLGFSQSSLAWVVNAYLIAFGGLLLLAGRLGDLLGRRNIFLAGLGALHRAPRCCAALAQSQEMLVAARFVQGIGGAMTSAVILGMIVTMFPEPREQAKAIGVYAFVASAGGSVGLQADRAAGGGDERVDADRLRLLARLGEHRDDHPEDHGGGHRAADALDEARADEQLLALRGAAQQRGGGEEARPARNTSALPIRSPRRPASSSSPPKAIR